MKDAILLLSGGIDSTTLLHQLRRDREVVAVVAHYGQTLTKEIEIARNNAARAGADVVFLDVDMSFAVDFCALLREERDIPTGRTPHQIASGGTPDTYVPFRNGILLAFAVAIGEARGITDMYAGANGLHSGNYYDDTDEFALAMQMAARAGTAPTYKPRIMFPYANFPKRSIVLIGLEIGVEYAETWSCYRNGAEHCGECDSCVQRVDAFGGRLNIKGERQ